nr:restriction endonuclease subunit S [Enterococcus faecalis]
MRDEMKKVPRLRFRGFQEDWEQRKLIDLVVRLNKSTNSSRLPKLEFEDIVAGEGRLNKDVSQKFDNRKGIEFLPNDILYGKLRPYLKNWLKATFTGVALGDFWVFRVKNSDSDFIYSLIQADRYQKAANDTSGTKMPRSDWKKVSGTVFYVPNDLKEQQKIGTLFKQIADAITLHQRKLEQLKELKKAYLQLMFVPTNTKNNKVPKLRFANFEENWELCKLENIIEKQIKGKAKVENLCNGSVEYLDANRLNGGKPIYTKALPDVSERDIIILWDGSKAGKVYYGFKGVLGSTLKAYQLKECANSQFIYQQLLDNQNNIYNNYRTPNIPHVVKNFSSIFPIWMTSFEEQSQMADILSNLDNRIILQQNLTDTMISLKKSYLQNMFI